MKISSYPVHLERFGINEIKYDCSFPPNNESVNTSDDYIVDFEYDIFVSEEDKILIECLFNIEPNIGSFGYKILLRCLGIFDFMDNSIEDEQRDQMIKYSCLPILLGSARGFLIGLTSNFIFGSYYLPMIDVKDFDKAFRRGGEKEEADKKKP